MTRRFRGGKGVATMAGAMVVLHPLTSLILTAVWFVARKTTRQGLVGIVGDHVRPADLPRRRRGSRRGNSST